MTLQGCHIKVGGTTFPPILNACACDYINKGPQFCDQQGHGAGIDVEFLLTLLIHIMNCTVECVEVSHEFDVKSALLSNRINISLTTTDLDNEGLAFNNTFISGPIAEDGLLVLTKAEFGKKPGNPTEMFDMLVMICGFFSILSVGVIEYLEIVWFPIVLSNDLRRVATAGRLLADFTLVSIVLALYSNMLTVALSGTLDIRTLPFKDMMDVSQSLYQGNCKLVVNRVLFQKDLKVYADWGATPQAKGIWPQFFREAVYVRNPPIFAANSSEIGEILTSRSASSGNCHFAIVYESQADYFKDNFCSLRAIPLQSKPPKKRFHFAISRGTSYKFVQNFRSATSDPLTLQAYSILVAQYAKPLMVPACKKKRYGPQKFSKLTYHDLEYLRDTYGYGIFASVYVLIMEAAIRVVFRIIRNIRHKTSFTAFRVPN